MHIIRLLASPHGERGNTAKLSELVAEGAREAGASIETIVLGPRTVQPCVACDTCHRVGTCPQSDEFAAILEKIAGADGVILASPNYIFSVTAQLKAFMDRCCGVIHRLAFEGKYGVSVVTSGGGEEQQVAEYMNHFLLVTGIRPVGWVGATMAAQPAEGVFTAEIAERAQALGAELVAAWRNGAQTTPTEEAMAAFKERMRALVSWRREEWPFEYRYWQEHRGLE